MPPQTLQRIEDGSTKSLTASARGKLTRALRVRDDEILAPIGTPFDRPPDEQPPVNDLIYRVCLDILAELRQINEWIRRPGRGPADDSEE
jgi:hypothetical protein